MKPAKLMLFAAAGFVLLLASAGEVMQVREEARRLTAELYELRRETRRRRDEQRGLALEYATATDYGVIRARALQLGMREPAPADGTFVYLAAEARTAEGAEAGR